MTTARVRVFSDSAVGIRGLRQAWGAGPPRPWGLTPNGDLLAAAEALAVQRGGEAQEVFKVKEHATGDHIRR
eukprot:15444893-Alexandrium_andersonii.AAC.1